MLSGYGVGFYNLLGFLICAKGGSDALLRSLTASSAASLMIALFCSLVLRRLRTASDAADAMLVSSVGGGACWNAPSRPYDGRFPRNLNSRN